jgi:hypothetical protein
LKNIRPFIGSAHFFIGNRHKYEVRKCPTLQQKNGLSILNSNTSNACNKKRTQSKYLCMKEMLTQKKKMRMKKKLELEIK